MLARTQVTKRFTFDAAHQLPNHGGRCARPHGHTYRVDVTVAGPVSTQVGAPDEGMVIDFGDLKAIWRTHLEPRLDHQDLNETLAGIVPVTTAEAIAGYIFDVFSHEVMRWAAGPDVIREVVRVDVWETPTGCATVERAG